MNPKALQARLAELRSRGSIKRFAAEADRDPALRAALEALAARRGLSTDPPTRWIVRALLQREEGARQRRNPIHRDPGFRCLACGRVVPPGGAQVRDHCPFCLRGLHVDDVPGDRSAGCRGRLTPTGFEVAGRAGVVIHYRCERCGHTWRGRAHPDDRLPEGLDPKALPPLPETSPGGSAPLDRARTLPRRVLTFIRRSALWRPGQRVVVAVSGGCDSTVLLELLHRLSAAHGGELQVVSIDHGLRPESVAEVAAVGRRARLLGLAFRGSSLDLDPGPDLAARARDARRAALLSLDADRVATGHHQDDQAETVLHNLLRGSGSAGLRGMLPVSAPWCRPLLDEPRAVIRAWAEQEGLHWVEDPSNPGSLRGRMRALRPHLDALHGGSGAALARSARLLAREDALLSALTDNAQERVSRDGGYDWSALRSEPDAIQLRLLRRLVAGCPRPVRADQLEPVLDWRPQGGGRLPLPAGWSLVYRGGVLGLETDG